MKARLETGLRLDGAGRAKLESSGSLAAALRKFDWFYVGAEFCENLIESPAWHVEQAAFFLERGARVGVLTPPLSERGLRRLRPVFRRLAAWRRRNPAAAGRLEVTVNDFGALQLAAETGLGLPLAAGRLLHWNFFRYDRHTLNLLNGEAVKLLAPFGLRRFELSATGSALRSNLSSPAALGLKAGDLSVTLHYPYINLTSGRACVTGMPDVRPEDSPAGIACRRECRACALEVDNPAINERLYVRGNTVFMKFPDKFYSSAASLLKKGIDRLVYSPLP